MSVVLVTLLTLVGLGGTAVVMTNAPERQALTLALYGVLLGMLFLALQAPDVALSQIGIGTAVVPLMVMLAIRKVRSSR